MKTEDEINEYIRDRVIELDSGMSATYVVMDVWKVAFAEGMASRESRQLSAVPSEEFVKDFGPVDYFNMERIVKFYCEKYKCQLISNEAYAELANTQRAKKLQRGIAG